MTNRNTFQLLAFFLLVFSTGALFGQETFRKYYRNSTATSDAVPYNLELLPEDGFLIKTSLPGDHNLVYSGFIYTDATGEVTQQITFGPGVESSDPPSFTRLSDGNYLVSKWRDDNEAYLLGKYSPDGELIWSSTGISEGQSEPTLNTELSNGELVLVDNYQTTIPGQGRVRKTSMVIFNAAGEELRRIDSDVMVFTTSMFPREDGVVLCGSSGPEAIVASYSIISGQEDWVYSFQGNGFGGHYCEDAMLLPDGTIGLLVNSLYDNPTSSVVQELEFIRLSTEGEELSRFSLDSNIEGLHSARMEIAHDGQLGIAYTAIVMIEGEWNTNEQFRFLKLDFSSGNISKRSAFNNPPCFAETVDVKLFSEGGGAILGMAFPCVSDTGLDILLLVFDANGQITNIRSASPLDATLSLSPNPTSDQLKVVLEGAASSALLTLQLYDANGREVFATNLDGNREATFDLSSYPNGTYFLVARDAAGRTTSQQVMKQ